MLDFLKAALMAILVMVVMYGCMMVGSAYEDHQKCLNGYTEVCIPEDFQ